MKRMSEVFNFDRGIGFPAHWSDECVRHADNAIKNVDALADALETVMHHYGDEMHWEVLSMANDALKSYRGEK